MKLRPLATMIFAALAISARAEDVVYLRLITGGHPTARYELTSKPAVSRSDVIAVPTKDIADLERAGRDGASSYYIIRTSPSVLPARYAVRELAPGVSYMQSLAGGRAGPARQATPTPKPGQWQPRGTMLDQPARR